MTEIVCSNLTLLGSKGEGPADDTGGKEDVQEPEEAASPAKQKADEEDDLPF
jgi:hypothetical protein